MGGRRRRRVEPADEWEQLELLCAWEEQVEYEQIRPLVLFGGSVPERVRQTGASERTLYRKPRRNVWDAWRDPGWPWRPACATSRPWTLALLRWELPGRFFQPYPQHGV